MSMKFLSEPVAAGLEATLLGPLMKGYDARGRGLQKANQSAKNGDKIA